MFKQTLFLFLFIVSSTAFAQDLYKVFFLKGQVEMERNGTKRSVLAGDYLLAGDKISTGEKSLALLSFGDGLKSKLKLTQNTDVVLEGIKKDKTDNNKEKTNFFINTGSVVIDFLNKDKIKKGLNIKTKTAAMGIRGTMFFVHVTSDNTTLVAVHNGVVLAKHSKQSTGVPLTSKEGIIFKENGASDKLSNPSWYSQINWKLNPPAKAIEELLHGEKIRSFSEGIVTDNFLNTKGKNLDELKFGKDQDLLKKKCDKEDAKSCTDLALYILKIEKIEDAKPIVMSLFQKACRLKDPKACVWTGRVEFEFGNKEKATNYMDKLCDYKNAYSCYTMWEVKKIQGDEAAANKYYKKSLELIHKIDNFEEAIADFKSGCDSKQSSSCTNLAILMENIGREKEAMELNKKACDMSDGVGCVNLGYAHQQKGENDQAFDYYQKACFVNEYVGCYNLACLYSKKKNEKLSAQYLKMSIIGGFNDWAHIEKDSDLVFLRSTQIYQSIKGEFKK